MVSGDPADAKYMVSEYPDLIPLVVKYIDHPDEQIVNQTFWFLANVVVDAIQIGDKVLQQVDILSHCYKLTKQPKLSRSLLQIVCWFVTNLSNRRIYSNDDFLKALFVFQSGMIVNDDEILSDCLWGLCYLTAREDEFSIAKVAGGETLPRIIEQMDITKSPTLFVPALKIIANIVSTNDEFILDKAVFEGVLGKLMVYLELGSSGRVCANEALWSYSNIIASGPTYIEAILNVNEGLIFYRFFEKLVSNDYDHKKEALMCLCNSIT